MGPRLARIPEQSPMDVLDRVLSDSRIDVDRLLVIAQDKDGTLCTIYSNARSESEMFGLAWRMMNNWEDVSDD